LPAQAADAAMHPRATPAEVTTRAPHYTLSGTIDVTTRSVTFRQTLRWTNDTGRLVTRLPFRLAANLPDFGGATIIHAAHIDGQPVATLQSHRGSIVTLVPRGHIPTGAVVDIGLDATTTIPVDAGDALYGAFNDDGSSLSFASAYPILTDFQGGNWVTDIPDTKGDLVNSPMARYDVTLTLPATHRLVSTGTTLAAVPGAAGTTYRVSSGLQRDFLFVATTHTPYTTMVDGTRVNVYADPGSDRAGAATAAAQSLRLFNARYGTYPYTELDFVGVAAGSFYGVEYPGLILLQDTLLTGDARRLETIVVHEVAHQWFYNLVGNDVQRDAWVDESLATYAQVVYRRAFGGPDAAAAELADLQRQYDRLVDRGLDAPVAQPMWQYTLYTFNVLAYAKGALFYEAVVQHLGPRVYDQILRRYVTTHQYATADASSFATVAAIVCGCSIEPLVDTWIHARPTGSTP
jgi:hypothetical protein